MKPPSSPAPQGNGAPQLKGWQLRVYNAADNFGALMSRIFESAGKYREKTVGARMSSMFAPAPEEKGQATPARRGGRSFLRGSPGVSNLNELLLAVFPGLDPEHVARRTSMTPRPPMVREDRPSGFDGVDR